MVGALQMADCSPTICAYDIPSISISTLTATYRVATRFSFTDNWYLVEQITYSALASCQYDRYVHDRRNIGYPYSVKTDDVATGTAVWNYVQTNQETGSLGKYLRPGTSVELANNLSWKANKYRYTLGSTSGSYVNPLVTTVSVPDGGDCCYPVGTTPVDKVTPGTVTSTTPSVTANLYLLWQACVEGPVPGINIALTSSGVSLSPWSVSVAGGAVTMTNNNGVAYSYTGTLTSAAAAINAAGYFTATVGAAMTLTSGVTNATVSDLIPFDSLPLSRTSCSTSLNVALPGYLLAPSSTGCGIAGFTFDPNLGFTDDAAGLELFVRAIKYPNSDNFELGLLPYFYQGERFDYLLYLTSFPYYRLTPGVSVQTYDVVLPAATTMTYNLVGIYYCGDPNLYNPCSAIPGGVGPEYCNGNWGVLQFDCNGDFVPNNCAPGSSACQPCVHESVSVVNLPEKTLQVLQTLSGSFTVA